MRILKNEAGKTTGVSTNDAPTERLKAMKATMITTTNIDQVKAKNAAAAKIEAEKEGGAK
jgi:hypothetical protein